MLILEILKLGGRDKIMKIKTCPINSSLNTNCLKEKCQWWKTVDDINDCVIALIPNLIESIIYAIKYK